MTTETWVALSAIASGLVAIATFALAWYTHDLAKETRQSLAISQQALDDERTARQAEDVRHMDGFLPHIALIPRDEVKDLAEPGLQTRYLSLYARNIGVGFAHNIRVSQSNAGNAAQFIVRNPPIALAVGEEVLLAARAYGNNLTFMGFTLTYDDAFGRSFESRIANDIAVHSRYSWNRIEP